MESIALVDTLLGPPATWPWKGYQLTLDEALTGGEDEVVSSGIMAPVGPGPGPGLGPGHGGTPWTSAATLPNVI